MLVGIIGCFIPFLPGPPLSYLALLIANLSGVTHFSSAFMIGWVVTVVIVVALEYWVPSWSAKKFGGSRAGQWGAAIGLVIGLFVFPPVGAIGGTMLGAFLAELLFSETNSEGAVKAALGALIGFFLSMGLRIIASVIMAFYLIKELAQSNIAN